MYVRTTVTLENDVARRLKQLMRARGMTFRDAVNAALRTGLNQMLAKPKARSFRTEPEDMGVFPHLNYDNIGELLEIAERRVRP